MDENSNCFIMNTINSNSNFSLAESYLPDQRSNQMFKKNHTMNKRTVFDAIHGHVEFDKYVWDFIDTFEFQRLRNLKQLGNAHFVFPGGSHSRFEHSIGVAHLSNKLINHLIKSVKEKYSVFNINNQQRINEDFNVQAVTLAGLLHDLGHGPFSHLFDRKVIKHLNPESTWEHEEGSSMLLEYLIDNNHIDIETEQRKLIQNLILGDIKTSDSKEFYYDSWIYNIVANKKNSIDVDKFDYICRDSYHIGLQSSNVDYDRIFSSAKIIDNNLCFNIKNDYNLLSLFQNRYKLFKQVYLHKKTIGIDLMIKDILILSDKHFNFIEVIHNPEEYIKLDDGILHQIENFSNYENAHPDLLKAAKMVKDLKYRNMYKYIGEILITSPSQNIKLEDVISCENPKDEFYLTAEDLELVSHSIDYGNSDRDPYEQIYFYKNEAPDDCFTISSKKVSLSVPKVFKESYLFLYCKNKNKVERAKSVFSAFLKRINAQNSELTLEDFSTPIKSNKKSTLLSNKSYRQHSDFSDTNKNLNIKFNKIN